MGHDVGCMSDTNFDALKQLLGCYFHQDWPDEFDSDVAVAKAMVANEPADLIAKGIVEINALHGLAVPTAQHSDGTDCNATVIR